jgi:hypothetical protein
VAVIYGHADSSLTADITSGTRLATPVNIQPVFSKDAPDAGNAAAFLPLVFVGDLPGTGICAQACPADTFTPSPAT